MNSAKQVESLYLPIVPPLPESSPSSARDIAGGNEVRSPSFCLVYVPPSIAHVNSPSRASFLLRACIPFLRGVAEKTCRFFSSPLPTERPVSARDRSHRLVSLISFLSFSPAVFEEGCLLFSSVITVPFLDELDPHETGRRDVAFLK